MDNTVISTVLPIFSFILIGYFCKRIKIVDPDFAKKTIKFLFFIPLPLLVLLTFASIKVESNLLIYPVLAIIISCCLILFSFLIAKILKFTRKTTGTFIAAAGITSTLLFALPFIQSIYGQEALKFLFLYDLGNGLMAWTVVYLLTGYLGNKRELGLKKGIRTFVKNPMIFALLLGIVLGLIGIQLPQPLIQFKNSLASFINPLLLITIGILLDFKYFFNRTNELKLILSAGVIMGVSLLLAIGFTTILGISGIGQKVILAAAISPAASLAVAFSVEHDLDQEYASALVTFTMTLGIFLVPLILLF